MASRTLADPLYGPETPMHARTLISRWLPLSLLATACVDDGGRESDSFTTAGAGTVSGATTTPTTTTTTTSDGGTSAATSDGATTAASSTTSATATSGTTTTTTTTTTEPTTSGDSTSAGMTSGDPPEHFMFSDPLIDGTQGTALGGSFGADGWTVTGKADRITWQIPRLVEGSVEFTVSQLTLDKLPLSDHEIFAMFEGGYDIEHPIGYNPEFRNNAFKSMIRIYGQLEADRVGQQKIMWGLCPFGAPGYHDGTCPCGDPEGFFDEPFGGDGAWDGAPQRLRVAWGPDGITRYSRNGAEVLTIDWSASGFTFGPEALVVSLGTPRPEEVDTAAMPIGAVFSDLVIDGWTGPASAICG